MNFTPDPLAEILVGCDNYETFQLKFKDVWLNPKTPQDVRDKFEIIKDLLKFSYYNFKFVDVAAMESLLMMEMALKIRYYEINRETWVKEKYDPQRNLFNLMKWFYDRFYFESENIEYINHIRKIRNYFAHPERFTFAGLNMKQWVMHPLDIINDLYEDPELRKKRFAILNEVRNKLEKFNTNGAILGFNNHDEIVYSINLLFVDNKSEQIKYHFVFLPIQNNFANRASRKPIIHIESQNFSFKKNNTLLTFNDYDEQINISLILKDEYKKELEKFKYLVKHDPYVSFYQNLLSSDVGILFNELRRSFHKK